MAPILLFTYNRPHHVQQVIESLLLNDEAKESDLFIFSDASKNTAASTGVVETRQFLRTISGFRSLQIIEREQNWGLASNIIDGVTTMVYRFGRVIVLEDDHVVSPYFLKYMNESLTRYENDNRVASIHGYVYPCRENLPTLFFIKGADCWSWATWKRAWDQFNPNGQELLDEIRRRGLEKNFDFGFNANYIEMLEKQIKGKNASWAVRWYASTFLKDMYTLYPGRSMMKMIGADGLGTHGAMTDRFDVVLNTAPINIDQAPEDVKENALAKRAFSSFFAEILSFKLKIYKYVCILFGRRILINRITN